MKYQKGSVIVNAFVLVAFLVLIGIGVAVGIERAREEKGTKAAMETDRCTLQTKVEAELPINCSGKGCPSGKPLVKTYKCESGKPTRLIVVVGEN